MALSCFSSEKIFIYNPKLLYETVQKNIEEEFSYYDKDFVHNFISWGLKKSFIDLTGYRVDNFIFNETCEKVYAKYRNNFDRYMFSVVRDLGAHLFKEGLNFNLVLTYERFYIITY